MGLRILVSNDDGWDSLFIVQLREILVEAGYDIVLSAPKEDQSGSGKCRANAPRIDV